MDFKDIYIVTARLESFYLLLVIVASLGLHMWQLDFVVAYLNNDIDFDIYME